jgi:hypothetical protein
MTCRALFFLGAGWTNGAVGIGYLSETPLGIYFHRSVIKVNFGPIFLLAGAKKTLHDCSTVES